MKLLVLFLAALALPPGASAQLLFQGSFWETSDFFEIRVDLGEGILHYVGSPEIHAWDADHESIPWQRHHAEIELTEEEVEAFRSIADRLPLFHSGYTAAIGTGLLTLVGLVTEEDVFQHHGYFALYYEQAEAPRNAAQCESFLANLAQSLSDGDLSEQERVAFRTALAELARIALLHEESIALLDECYRDDRAVPWRELVARHEEPFFPSQEHHRLAERLSREAGLVVSALVSSGAWSQADAPAKTHAVVQVGYLDEESDDGFVQMLPLPVIDDGQNEWTYLPHDLIGVLGDFAALPGFGSYLHYERVWPLRIPVPGHLPEDDEIRKKIEFLENSGWERLMFDPPLPESAEVAMIKIASLTFSDNLGRCLVVVDYEKAPRRTLIFEVKDSEWHFTGQLSEDDVVGPFADPFK